MSRFRPLGAVLIALAMPVMLAAQQSATITGRVTSNTGVPIAGANVLMSAANVGMLTTITGPDGSFSMLVPGARFSSGQRVELVAQSIGYRSAARTVTLSSGGTVNQDFSLDIDPLRLEDVVVTGAGTERVAERLATARAVIDAVTLQRANELNTVQALVGKIPNVLTNQQSGDAGASTAIQIRGYKSFGTSQPLIVVDGLPINNSTRSTSNPLSGAVQPNRAIDINPEDIATVEILKGAAATSIYGVSAGSAGAILITTKRGEAGRTRYTFRSNFQADQPIQMIPLQRSFGMGTNSEPRVCATMNCSLSSGFFSWGARLDPAQPTFDHANEMYETGSIWDNTLAVSGGNERTTFYLSGSALHHNGFMIGNNDFFRRYTARLNASHELLENLQVGGSASYVQTQGSGNQRGNQIGGLLGAFRTPPEFDNKVYLHPSSGLHRSFRFQNPGPNAVLNNRGFDNPFYMINEAESLAETGRIFGSINANFQPFPWLELNYTLGADYSSDDRTEAFPQSASGAASGGLLERWQFYDRTIDSNLLATTNFTVMPGIQSSVSVGQNLKEVLFRQVTVSGRTWIAPRPYKLTNTVTRTSTQDPELRTRTEGYFLQLTTDIEDQIFLQARVRNDGNSRFGPGNQRAWYPGGSVAWSFTKTIPFPENILTFGKLRAAYGETGQEPPIYLIQDTYSGATISDFNPGAASIPTQEGVGGLFESGTKGNRDIRPERVRSLEAGIDLNLFRGRADLSVTGYTERAEDVIFSVNTPASTGYTAVVLNAAEITNRGWEATLAIRPIQHRNISLELAGNWAMNRNMLESLGAINLQLSGQMAMPTADNCGPTAQLPRCTIGFAPSFGGQSTAAQVGYPLGVVRGQDYARCGYTTRIAEVEAACAAANAPLGALYIGANGYPIVDPDTRVISNPEPDWTAGLSALLNIKGVQLSAFVDHRQGGDVLNMTRASLYQYGTHKDTEIRDTNRTFGQDWPCQNKTCAIFNGPVVGPGAGTAVPVNEAWFNSAAGGGIGGPPTNRIEDGTYTRLREVSIGYSFTQPWVARFAGTRALDLRLSARNLKLWTDYTGFDPETNLGGAEVANRGIDWFNNPLARAFVVSVTIHH